MQTKRFVVRTRPGFSIVTVLVACVVVAVLLVVLLVALSSTTGEPGVRNKLWGNTQLRGIHYSMFADSQSNRGWLPGVTGRGALEPADDEPGNGFIDGVGGAAVTCRMAVLLTNDFFTGEIAINPADTRTPWTDESVGDVTLDHLSYALAEIAGDSARRSVWRADLNHQVVIGSDRNAGPERGRPLGTIHRVPAGAPDDSWRGSVAWADIHVAFEPTHVLETAYGPAETRVVNPADDLFHPAGDADAWQVFE